MERERARAGAQRLSAANRYPCSRNGRRKGNSRRTLGMVKTSSAARYREERRSLAPRICSPRDAASGRGRAETPPRGHRGGGADAPSHGGEWTPNLAMRLGTAWLDPPDLPPERVCARARGLIGGTVGEPRNSEEGRTWASESPRRRQRLGRAARRPRRGRTRTLRPSAAWDARVQTRRSRRLPRWENRFVHSGPWGRRTDAAFLFKPCCQPGV